MDHIFRSQAERQLIASMEAAAHSDKQVELLYNIFQDPFEMHDLAKENPAIVAKMKNWLPAGTCQ